MTVSATVMDSIPTWKKCFFFYFLALVTRQSAALSSAIQPGMTQNMAESGEQRILTLFKDFF